MKPKITKKKKGIKQLSKLRIAEFKKVLKVKGGINKRIKEGKISKEEKEELKSFAIKEAVQIKKYVRN